MATVKTHSAATVIRAQKRVLNLALNTIGRMSKRQLRTLRACGGGGVITFNELSGHIVAALHLKARPIPRVLGREGGEA